MVNREIKARKRAVKEEKEEIDGEIVRIRKGHPRTNLPVKLPENPTWLKPYLFIYSKNNKTKVKN